MAILAKDNKKNPQQSNLESQAYHTAQIHITIQRSQPSVHIQCSKGIVDMVFSAQW